MSASMVLQFRISLKEIEPLIWRRIQIPYFYSFWDLHVAIQDAMGWWDSHLHHFVVKNPKTKRRELIGIPGDDPDEYFALPGWGFEVWDYLKLPSNQDIEYLYDFGDHWVHCVQFEGAYSKQGRIKRPICLEGERACPPEDVGGVDGYKRYVQIMSDPKHEAHAEMRQWRGAYDPNQFDHTTVKFSNSQKRLKDLLAADVHQAQGVH